MGAQEPGAKGRSSEVWISGRAADEQSTSGVHYRGLQREQPDPAAAGVDGQQGACGQFGGELAQGGDHHGGDDLGRASVARI